MLPRKAFGFDLQRAWHSVPGSKGIRFEDYISIWCWYSRAV